MDGCDIVIGAAAVIALRETIAAVGTAVVVSIWLVGVLHAWLTSR